MKRIALLTLSILLALAGCWDQPTAPVAEGPSFAAVHGEGVPAREPRCPGAVAQLATVVPPPATGVGLLYQW